MVNSEQFCANLPFAIFFQTFSVGTAAKCREPYQGVPSSGLLAPGGRRFCRDFRSSKMPGSRSLEGLGQQISHDLTLSVLQVNSR